MTWRQLTQPVSGRQCALGGRALLDRVDVRMASPRVVRVQLEYTLESGNDLTRVLGRDERFAVVERPGTEARNKRAWQWRVLIGRT